jgi:hypothetical protein
METSHDRQDMGGEVMDECPFCGAGAIDTSKDAYPGDKAVYRCFSHEGSSLRTKHCYEAQIANLQLTLRQTSPFIQFYIALSGNPILANQAAALLPEIERWVGEGEC